MYHVHSILLRLTLHLWISSEVKTQGKKEKEAGEEKMNNNTKIVRHMKEKRTD